MWKSSILLACSAVVGALNFGEWNVPAEGDERSPCPALNSLANHGLINRDGKNLAEAQLVQAQVEAFNVSTEVATALFNNGMRTSSNPETDTFSLSDLTKHGIIEHDASLSRQDTVTGDAASFSQEIFDDFLSFFEGSDVITIPTTAAARFNRVRTERGRNPDFQYTAGDRFSSFVETAIMYELFKDVNSGNVSKEFVKIWFEEERLPFDEGWRPNNPISGLGLTNTVLSLAMNTPEKEPGLDLAQIWGYHAALLR